MARAKKDPPRPTDAARVRPPARGFSRHFEGWQPGLLAVVMAGVAALLVVPRPVAIVELPDPLVDARALDRVAVADAALAQRALQQRLDVDVLKLGTALFAFNEAQAATDEEGREPTAAVPRQPARADSEPVSQEADMRRARSDSAYRVSEREGREQALRDARAQVLDAVARALAIGPDAILTLRALHLRIFLREVRRWEATGEETDKLREVSGDFVRGLKDKGWIVDGRILLDTPALAAAYKVRWGSLLSLGGDAFDLTLDEKRVLYRFMFRHPVATPAELSRATLGAPRTKDEYEYARRRIEADYRLRKVEEYGSVDPTYPYDLAHGVAYYLRGRYPRAVVALREHLERVPDGPFTLRAQNYLRTALDAALSSSPDGALPGEKPHDG